MTEPAPRRLCLTLWLAGLAAVVSLLAAPLEGLQPKTMHLPWWQFRLLGMVNPLILVSAAVALGCWAARRVGLDAPLIRALLEREPAWPALRRQLGPAIATGVATALVLWSYGRISAPWFAAANLPDLAMPLVTKLLYGGVAEELMCRWGLMSLFVWLAWKIARSKQPRPGAFVAGALIAALLFAAGHLPLLFMVLPQPPAGLVLAVLAGNALPGLLFGLLFWRHGLEAAVQAHALGHLLFTLAG